jgi:hypothetical protein
LVPEQPAEWVALSNSGDYPGARASIDKQGGFDAVFGKASPSQKMAVIDVARLTKETAWAIKALRAIIDQNPNDPYASIAVLQLASMLDRSGDRAGAAQAYAKYRQLKPNGEFADDALVRQFDAVLAQGDVAQAKKLAEQYAKDFPSGRSLGRIRAAIAKLSPGASAPKPESHPDSGSAPKAEDDTPYDEVDDPPAKKK